MNTTMYFRGSIGIILFNDVHILDLMSELINALLSRMNVVLDDYDGEMIPADERNLNFLTFVLS